MSTTQENSRYESSSKKQGLSRREVVSLGWLAAAGALGLSSVGIVRSLLRPSPITNENRKPGRDPLDLGLAGELPGPDAGPIHYPKDRLLLVAQDEGYTAFATSCPSRGCVLGWKPDQDRFICPCCGSFFDPEGVRVSGPTTRNLDYYEIQAFDQRGREIARTPESGGPVRIPAQARVVVYPGEKRLGAEAEAG